ncbi:MAG: hypothetical protein ACP5N3_01910 [Candidatus Nanoarchaeia archaeon]
MSSRKLFLLAAFLSFGYAGYSQQDAAAQKKEEESNLEKNVFVEIAEAVKKNRFTSVKKQTFGHYDMVFDLSIENRLGYKWVFHEDSTVTEYIVTEKFRGDRYTADLFDYPSGGEGKNDRLVIVGSDINGRIFANYVVLDIYDPFKVMCGYNKRSGIRCSKGQMPWIECENFKPAALKEVNEIKHIFKGF